MVKLFSTLIVSKFYKVNAGFFLFAFLILFAILPGPDTIRLHHALMLATVSSPVNAGGAFLILSLYNLKCISFTNRELNLPENIFLYNLQGLSNARQLILLAVTHLSLYLPLLAYSLITAFVGFQSQHIAGGLFMLISLVAMIGSGTLFAFNQIDTTWKKPAIAIPSVTLFPDKGFYSYLLHYSLNNKKGTFISIKIFSMLALQVLVVLNADKVSKENICFLMLLSISAHALLPAYFVRFLETEMSFLRNLPIPLYKRLGQFTFTYLVILFPELLFLLYNEISLMSVSGILSIYLLGVARLSLYTTIQYLPGMNLNKYTGVLFVIFFITIILLASFSLWLFILLELIMTVLLFSFFYYRYEPLLLNE